MHKVPGAENCSDLMTKNVSRELIERHVTIMNAKFMGGRTESAVQLHVVEKKIRQAKVAIGMVSWEKGCAHIGQERQSDQCLG